MYRDKKKDKIAEKPSKWLRQADSVELRKRIMIRLYEDGMKPPTIALHMDMNHATVYHHLGLKKYSYKPKHRKRYSIVERKQIMRLYNESFNFSQIADKLCRSKEGIRRFVEYNLEMVPVKDINLVLLN